MSISKLRVPELKQAIEDQLQHTFLEKYIEKPFIDDDKLMILSSIINNTSYSEIKKNNYIITTMLVQVALDTHDLVTENEILELNTHKKTRQLTVLAGDYYSGLYYHLLAKIDDIKMIHTLASAIKEINELKMSIYYESYRSLSDFIDKIKELESLLIIRVAEHMQQWSVVNDITRDWLLIKKLIREKNLYLETGYSSVFELITNESNYNLTYNQVVPAIEDIIQNQTKLIERLIFQLPFPFQALKKYISSTISNNLSEFTFVMEEG